jgi:hypothetical protein
VRAREASTHSARMLQEYRYPFGEYAVQLRQLCQAQKGAQGLRRGCPVIVPVLRFSLGELFFAVRPVVLKGP